MCGRDRLLLADLAAFRSGDRLHPSGAALLQAKPAQDLVAAGAEAAQHAAAGAAAAGDTAVACGVGGWSAPLCNPLLH